RMRWPARWSTSPAPRRRSPPGRRSSWTAAGWPEAASMPDMLVKLYELPDSRELLDRLREAGVVCRRAESFERSAVLEFVAAEFPHWQDEAATSFAHVPPTLFVAARGQDVVGFACFNATRP